MQYLISLLAVLLACFYYSNIRKRCGRVVRLIYIVLLYNLIIKYLVGNLGLPSMLNYFTDFIMVWILIEYYSQKKQSRRRIPKSMITCFVILWTISLFSYIGNMYSPLLYLWGFRNNFRFIIFAMMCAVYLRRIDVETIMDIFFGFFVLNLFVVSYQFFFYSYSEGSIGDFISGLYSNGLERGGNGALSWLAIIVLTHGIVNYLNKNENLYKMLISVVGTIYIATLAEIKILYFLTVIIGIMAMLICKKSYKSFFLAFGGVYILLIGIDYLYMLFPDFKNFFEYEVILSYLSRDSGYTAQGIGLDRLTAIPYVFENYLTNIFNKLMGIGLGNADFSAFDFLTSDFYVQNHISGYNFFYSSFLLIEIGIIGAVAYILNILNYIRNSCFTKQTNIREKSLSQMGVIIGMISIFFIFSNVSIRMESSGYMVYCVLSLPFILSNKGDFSVLGDSLIRKVSFKRRKSKGLCIVRSR